MRIRSAALALCTAAVAAGALDVRPLPFYYDLYTFRGDDGQTDVVAAFAVPAGRLEAERRGGRARYRFDVSLVLADTATESVIRADDSVYVEMPSRPDSDHLLYTHIQVASMPSATTFHRVIMSDATVPGVGQLYGDPFRIRDYSGSALMLSDVALGHPQRGEGGWRRGDVAIALLPTTQFPGSEFDVYYEIYNLPRGHEYRTEITVTRADGRDPEAAGATVRFRNESDAGPDGMVQELRRVDTSLPRGKHRITVTVTDLATNASATRSRTFTVRDAEREATMVPALPRR